MSKLLTKQEIFDKAVNGLAGQGFIRSRQTEDDEEVGESRTKCLYRGLGGTKCAVGHLIPDDVYEEWFNSYGVNSLPSNVLLAAGLAESSLPGDFESYRGVLVPERYFIGNLQLAHDESETPAEMKSRLLSLGVKYSLVIPEVMQ
jgi:hypothetical protein